MTPRRGESALAEVFSIGVAAASKIYQGALVGINGSGYAVAGASFDDTTRAIGRAEAQADNTSGAAGDINVSVRRGVFKFVNSSSNDALTIADVGNECFLVDDQTVARTNTAGTRGVAGLVIGVDTDGVWVECGPRRSGGVIDLLLTAGEALTSDQYKIMAVSAASTVIKCATAGGKCIGILQNAPGNGGVAIVRVAGMSKCKADGTGWTLGDAISSTNAGLARASTNQATGLAHTNTGDAGAATDPLLGAYILGIALETAGASATKAMLITNSGALVTTAV
jgi:hypothetical protein